MGSPLYRLFRDRTHFIYIFIMGKKAKRSGSNVFTLFPQKTIQEFKEAFGIIDADKDGMITVNDLKQAFNQIGRPITDAEASGMVGEAPGPINFTQMVTMFAEKMAGAGDDDKVILMALGAFEIDGKIDAEMFRHSLMTWGEKFSAQDVDDAFAEFNVEGGVIDGAALKALLVTKSEE